MRTQWALLAVFGALAQTPNGVNFYSIPKEIELGRQLAAQTQAQLKAEPDARLQAIVDKLAAQAGGDFQYRCFTYSKVSPEFEPIAIPGGPIFVARNMLPAGDAVTAAILAHGMAHIALRHYTRELTRESMTQSSRGQASMGQPSVGQTSQAPAGREGMPPRIASNVRVVDTMRMAANPIFENEADQLAIKLLIAAGYDPEGLVRWLESIPIAKSNLQFGDRPTPSARLVAAQRAIENSH